MTDQCGRRTCDRDATIGFTTDRGALRSRCPVHALADDVDGIGESRAEAILEVVSLEGLVERCDGADGTHAPVVLSKIDGLGPDSAASIAAAVDESNVARALREVQTVPESYVGQGGPEP